jgi:drug/metabolite transporter (DMT)-like permease
MDPYRLRAYLLLLIVTAIWGIAEPVIKFTLGGFSPVIFLTYRFAISTVIALVIFAISGIHFPKDTKTRIELIACGLLTSTISLGLLFFGMERTTVLDTTLITLINPLLVSFVGVRFLNEHVTLKEKAGMAIALVGTILTVIEPFLQNGHTFTRFSGNILIVLYLVANIAGVVLAKKLLRKEVTPLTITNFSFVLGFVSFLPFALPQILSSGFQVLTSVPISYHLGVLYMAVLSGSLAYFLSNKAQKTIEVGEASVFTYLYPLFAAPLAIIWLGEKITPIYITGAVIITVGVLIAEVKKKPRCFKGLRLI